MVEIDVPDDFSGKPFAIDARVLTDYELEEALPFLNFRDPLRIRCENGKSGYGCKFCIARRGIKASEIGNLPQTKQAWAQHMIENHPKVQ